MKKNISWSIRLIVHLGLYIVYRLAVWTTLGTKIIEITNNESDTISNRIGRYFFFFSIGFILFYIIGELITRFIANHVPVVTKRLQSPYIVLTHFLLFSGYYLHVSFTLYYIGLQLIFRDDEAYRAVYRQYLIYVISAILVTLFLMFWNISREEEGTRTRAINETPLRIIIHLSLFAVFVFVWPASSLAEEHDSIILYVMGLLRSQYIIFSVCFLLLYYGGEILYRQIANRECSLDSLFSSIWSFPCYLFIFYIGLRKITYAVDSGYITYRINESGVYHVDNPFLQDGRLAWLWFAYGTTILAFIVVLSTMPHGLTAEYGARNPNNTSDSATSILPKPASNPNKDILFCFPMMEFYDAAKNDPPAAAEINRAALADIRNGQTNEAIKKLRACNDLYPTFLSAYHNLGILYGLQKNYILSEDSFLQADKIYSHEPSVKRGLALCKFLQGEYSSCLKICNEYASLISDEKLSKLAECCRIQISQGNL